MHDASERPVLLFDVMSTLVHDPFYEEMPAFFGMSLEQLLAAKEPEQWPRFERGEIDEQEFARTFFRDRRAYDYEGLKECVREAYRWIDGMEELLGDLKGTGWSLHAFSNYPEWYHAIEEKLRLSRFLRWTFVSCEHRLRKPDVRAYRRAALLAGAELERCLVVDDRRVNCGAAVAAGMRAVRFTDCATLREQLESWP